jgi:hypothetical protein
MVVRLHKLHRKDTTERLRQFYDISLCFQYSFAFAQDENQFIYNGFHQAFIIGMPGLTAFIGLPNNKYYSDKKHS